jgi:hypothetical protein
MVILNDVTRADVHVTATALAPPSNRTAAPLGLARNHI